MAAHGAKATGSSAAAAWAAALCPALPKPSEQSRVQKDRGGVYAHDKLGKGLVLQTGTVLLSPGQLGLGWA